VREILFRDMTKSFNEVHEEGFIGMTIISGRRMELDDYVVVCDRL
jgi:glutaredoxin-related protein